MKLGLSLCIAKVMLSIFLQPEFVTVHVLQVMQVFTELGQAGFKGKSVTKIGMTYIPEVLSVFPMGFWTFSLSCQYGS